VAENTAGRYQRLWRGLAVGQSGSSVLDLVLSWAPSYIYIYIYIVCVCVCVCEHNALSDRDNAIGIAIRYGLGRSGGRIPLGGEIFLTRPYRTCSPPSLIYSGYRLFPGGKAAGAWR